MEDLIDAQTVERLRERYGRLFRGEFETGVAPDEVNWQEGKSDPSLTRQICNGWKADRLSPASFCAPTSAARSRSSPAGAARG